MQYAIKILEENEDTIKLGGYGVIFGGRDLTGDTFKADTDLQLKSLAFVPTYYDHNQGEIKGMIGSSVVSHIDEIGVFFETELDKSKKYIEQVLKLVRKGVLGYSTGAVSHLVERENGNIKTWPLAELSCTVTPAEPRTIGIETKTETVTDLGDITEDVESVIEEVALEGDIETGVETDTIKGDLQIMDEKKEVNYADEIKALTDEMAELKAIKTNPLPVADIAIVDNSDNDNFMKYVRDGGNGGYELKALNITTATEGGETVPVGFYNRIIESIEELNPLHMSVGAQAIPGIGTTVNVPVEDGAAGVMTASTESAAEGDYEPTFKEVAVTYVTYRGVVAVTHELLRDNDVNLSAFLVKRFSKLATNTMNNAFVTEIETNGTLFETFASATAIAAGEIENIAMNDTVAPYLESGDGKFIMRESTKGAVQSITGDRFYVDGNGASAVGQNMLVGYPVQRSSYADAMTTALKPVLFGSFDQVGYRMADGIEILRDPFSKAANGQVLFHVALSYAVKVLQSDAVGYGQLA